MKRKNILGVLLLIGVCLLVTVLLVIKTRRSTLPSNDRGTAISRSAVWQARFKALDAIEQDESQSNYEYSVNGSNPTGGNT